MGAEGSLQERFTHQIPEVARRAVRLFAAEVPYYRLLPQEVLDGEITEFTTQNIRICATALRERRLPTEAELAGPLIAVTRRAQEDIPLAAILAVYHVAARVGMEVLREIAEPAEFDDVLAAGQHVQRYLQELVPAVTTAYLEERQALHSETREARRTLFDALVTGRRTAEVEEAAERAGVALAPAYAALWVHLPGPADGPEANIGATVLGRRRTHRLQDILDEYTREPVLNSLDGRGGTVLLPATPAALPALFAELPELLDRFSKVAGNRVTAGAADAPDLAAIAVAAHEAREVAVLAQSLGRGPGLYFMADMLLEYQLTRPSRARDRLAALTAPLLDHPHLLDAVRAYLDHEHNRRLAAKALHVHPNTLDYRLRRAGELTGLDPALASDARKLAAALLVRTVIDGTPQA